ncbi:hypothetical protein J437_LFUL018947 [Ladona fulva]|uniref:Chaperone DnaJ C-terminal domain-containing protein n=1 Tax=Ladona fulva TaxID=123851 RepID=A0A8K0KRB7_LADFU|nr:hypothetical protein J437_LFUL018947 [Ladona fulva]
MQCRDAARDLSRKKARIGTTIGGESRSGRSGEERGPARKGRKQLIGRVPPGKPLTKTSRRIPAAEVVLIQRRELCTTAQEEPAITRKTEILRTIQIRPGIPPGTEFRFSEVGNQAPDIIPGDVIFVTEDKPHETFRREGLSPQTKRAPKLEHQNSGNQFAILIDKHIDEIHTERDTFITHFPTPMPHLSMALTGFTAKVETIDGRTLRIPITEIVSPSYEKIIQREGLPVFGVEDGRKGRLRMRFDIQFPIYPFPSKNRLSLKQALTSGIMKSEEKEFDDSVTELRY